MKFGDVIMAVASFFLIEVLLYAVLMFIFLPLFTSWSADIAGVISVFVTALIVGYLFSQKIQEKSSKEAITKIAVLSAVVLVFGLMILYTNSHMDTAINEIWNSGVSTGDWTSTDWLVHWQFSLLLLLAYNVVAITGLSFIGLYAGSKLRKPIENARIRMSE